MTEVLSDYIYFLTNISRVAISDGKSLYKVDWVLELSCWATSQGERLNLISGENIVKLLLRLSQEPTLIQFINKGSCEEL